MVNEAINENRMVSEWMFNFLVKKANENGWYTVIIVDNKKYNFIFFLSHFWSYLVCVCVCGGIRLFQWINEQRQNMDMIDLKRKEEEKKMDK